MHASQFALLIVSAAFFGFIVRRFKQPLLIGYLLAGFLLAWLGWVQNLELVSDLGKIGVTLLLFLVGIEMNVKELPTIGKTALLTGLGQIIFTFSLATIIARILGYSFLVSSYIAIALSFSSTIIIIKLLSEKNALKSLYGKISIGFLLIQDVVAIAILLVLSSIQQGGANPITFALMIVKGVFLIAIIWFLSKKAIPYLFEKYIAQSQELLFISSIAWVMGVSSFVAGPMGFSLEIGGFLAGIALSNLPEHLEIASKTKPLRDFFLTIFFLSLGASLNVSDFALILFPAIIFSLLVLLGNPLIVITIMGFLKFKRRTSFLSSVTVAQISEFSLIVIAMGVSLGHLAPSISSMMILIAIITMTTSTYLILNSERVYSKLKNYLKIFERKDNNEIKVDSDEKISDHVVLIGCYRTGARLLTLLKKRNMPYLIVDFNPDVFARLKQDGFPIIYGDISDPETLIQINIEKAKMVISTIDNVNDNLILLEYIKRFKHKAISVFTCQSRTDALILYSSGANYVIVPDVVAGDYLRHILNTYGIKGSRLIRMGRNHYKRLVFT